MYKIKQVEVQRCFRSKVVVPVGSRVLNAVVSQVNLNVMCDVDGIGTEEIEIGIFPVGHIYSEEDSKGKLITHNQPDIFFVFVY